ncbi:hypothetical protein ABZP36_010088 [Zizania latifolia]
MRGKGHRLDAWMFNALMRACVKEGTHQAVRLFDEMSGAKIEPDQRLFNFSRFAKDLIMSAPSALGWLSLSRNTLSTTDSSVAVVSAPQKAVQSLTAMPAANTSLPRLMEPAARGTCSSIESSSRSSTDVCGGTCIAYKASRVQKRQTPLPIICQGQWLTEFVRKTEGCHYLLIIIPSYAVAIVALCKLRDADRLLLVLRKMDDAVFAPWDFTYNSVVDVLVMEGRMEEALHLKDEMLAASLVPSIAFIARSKMIVYTAFNFVCACPKGFEPDAKILYMDKPNQAVPYNINGVNGDVGCRSLLDNSCNTRTCEYLAHRHRLASDSPWAPASRAAFVTHLILPSAASVSRGGRAPTSRRADDAPGFLCCTLPMRSAS